MRPIDANLVLYAAESEFPEEDAAKIRWLISHIPTVDAVPVVRCVDCVYRNNKHKCPIAFAGLHVVPAWYCAWGAKEDRGAGDIIS